MRQAARWPGREDGKGSAPLAAPPRAGTLLDRDLQQRPVGRTNKPVTGPMHRWAAIPCKRADGLDHKKARLCSRYARPGINSPRSAHVNPLASQPSTRVGTSPPASPRSRISVAANYADPQPGPGLPVAICCMTSFGCPHLVRGNSDSSHIRNSRRPPECVHRKRWPRSPSAHRTNGR